MAQQKIRFEIVYSKLEISQSIKKLAKKLLQDFPQLLETDTPIIFECLLNGATVFTKDLLTELKNYGAKNFILHKSYASSYGSNTITSGKVIVKSSLKKEQVTGKTIIILDDVCDSGLTIHKFKQMYEQMGARVKIAVAVDKRAGRNKEFTKYVPDYALFTLYEPLWLEGYGMDTNGRGRRKQDIVQVIQN